MIAVETWKSELSQKNGLHQDNLLHVLSVDYLFSDLVSGLELRNQLCQVNAFVMLFTV